MSAAARRLALLIALVAVPHAAAAQDTPVTFLHGFASSQQTWQATASRLATTLRIEPHGVDLPWTQPVEQQAGVVNAAKGSLPASTIVVAHSQGGLVARQWSRSKPLSGILTLGSPHGGALLAQRALDVISFNYLLYNLVGLATAFGPGTEFAWIYAALEAYYNAALQISWNTAVQLGTTTAVMNYVPVAPQLVPGSAFLRGINEATNLAREGSGVRHRVGLVFAADQYWRAGAAVGLAPDHREWVWGMMVTLPVTFEYAAAYLEQTYGPLNLPARSFATRLREIAGAIRSLDPLWCWAVTDDSLCRIPHDGIVSVAAQAYPGGMTFGVTGPAHTQETTRSEREIASVLTGIMGVGARGAVEPPPAPGGDPTGPGTLTAGMRLYADQQVAAPGGEVILRYQSDGNLVLYGRGGTPLWASDTDGLSAGRVEMQTDGNLVIYDASGIPRWASGTAAYGAYLRVHDAGYAMVHDSSGVGLWWTGSGNP